MVSTRWNSHASDLELKSRGAFFLLFFLFSLISSFGSPPPPPLPCTHLKTISTATPASSKMWNLMFVLVLCAYVCVNTQSRKRTLAFPLLVKSWRKCFCCCYCIVYEILTFFVFCFLRAHYLALAVDGDTAIFTMFFYLPSVDARAMPCLALC